jgi:hypothetical protein
MLNKNILRGWFEFLKGLVQNSKWVERRRKKIENDRRCQIGGAFGSHATPSQRKGQDLSNAYWERQRLVIEQSHTHHLKGVRAIYLLARVWQTPTKLFFF